MSRRRLQVIVCAASVAVLGVVGLVAGTAGGQTDCQEIVFEDFSDTSGLTLNGSAATAVTSDGTVLRVTPSAPDQSGSAFSSDTLSLADDASFSSFFSFRFSNQGGGGADGLVFAVQTVSDTVGGSGGGIGYDGLADSVGVEFDNWFNAGFDDDDNHVGIDLDGSIASDPRAPMPWLLDDPAAIHYAWVDYNGATDQLEVRVAQSNTRPATAILTKTVDLVATLGATDAFAGFTSGTGSAQADHDVLSWTMRTCFDPVGAPTTTSTTSTTVGGGVAPAPPATPVADRPSFTG
jgi:hypothetical protein